jgi:type I restriction enzyme R subunit
MTRHSRDESEWLTRKRSIDPKLKSWGWTVIPFDLATSADQRGCYAIAEYPTANGPADYALAVNGKVLGIVERSISLLHERRDHLVS